MKLASLKGGRDGRLAIVSADLAWATSAHTIAPTLQVALDNWEEVEGPLRALALSLETGGALRERFHEHEAAAPLPRAFQWADGSAYVNHVALVRKARGAELPDSFWTDPLIYQGGSDGFLGARDPIPLASEDYGCDFEAEVAVIVGDVRQGATREEAAKAIRLITLVNDVSLRNLIPNELAKGFGFFQSKPASSFAPVVVTPDELTGMWDGTRLKGPLEVFLNGQPFGAPDASVDMTFDFPTLIAHAAKTRALCAGSIIGSGTVSNRGADGGAGKPISQGGLGYACIAEQRMVETLDHGAPKTPFLKFGDEVRIEMRGPKGRSVFGAIEQRVSPCQP